MEVVLINNIYSVIECKYNAIKTYYLRKDS